MKAYPFAILAFCLISVPMAACIDPQALKCPDSSIGETQSDCPWAGISRALQAEAKNGDDVLPLMKVLAPGLVEQFEGISRLDKSWPDLWASSINYDEFAHGQIVDPAILEAISEASGIRIIRENQTFPGRQIVHAGMEHTYGYLFSTLKTPFGYKRSRWVSGELERKMGLPAGLLGPKPEEGTLFGNVTYFMGRIALRDAPARLALLERGKWAAPGAFLKYDFASLRPTRIEETVQAPLPGGGTRRVTLRTDLVPFVVADTGNANDKDSGLLIYSVDDEAQDGPRVITAFPAAPGTAQGLLNPATAGDAVQISTKYNGYVQGLSEQPLTGTRRIIAPPQAGN